MKVVLLTSRQADEVRGRHGKYSALEPVPIDNNMFILPVSVVEDPEHSEVFSKLGECKYANIDIVEETDDKLQEEDPMKYMRTPSVKEVSSVSISVEKELTTKPTYEKVIK